MKSEPLHQIPNSHSHRRCHYPSGAVGNGGDAVSIDQNMLNQIKRYLQHFLLPQCEILIDKDPSPRSHDGIRLQVLAKVTSDIEKILYPELTTKKVQP